MLGAPFAMPMSSNEGKGKAPSVTVLRILPLVLCIGVAIAKFYHIIIVVIGSRVLIIMMTG